jgi:hypothetical protein
MRPIVLEKYAVYQALGVAVQKVGQLLLRLQQLQGLGGRRTRLQQALQGPTLYVRGRESSLQGPLGHRVPEPPSHPLY